MHYLYVCCFSNGFIKVGRSNDPKGRIAQHEERVSCMGITLTKQAHFGTEHSVVAAEMALIERCAKASHSRHKQEWFQGLSFEEVCRWAEECANTPYVPAEVEDGTVNFARIVRALMASGMTQMQIAALCGCNQSSVSEISNGKVTGPSYSIGAALLRLLDDLRAQTA